MSDGRRDFEITIDASPDEVWEALTDPQQTRQFWHGALNHSTWQAGARWTSESETGELYLDGEIVELDRPRRMVHTMRFLQDADAATEPPSLVEINIDALDGGSRLRLINTNLGPQGLENVTSKGGWEYILAGLKSVVESGEPVAAGASDKM